MNQESILFSGMPRICRAEYILDSSKQAHLPSQDGWSCLSDKELNSQQFHRKSGCWLRLAPLCCCAPSSIIALQVYPPVGGFRPVTTERILRCVPKSRVSVARRNLKGERQISMPMHGPASLASELGRHNDREKAHRQKITGEAIEIVIRYKHRIGFFLKHES